MSLNKILGGLLKALQFWKKGHDAGLWDQKQGYKPKSDFDRPSEPTPKRPF